MGSFAFGDCINLTRITLPEGLASIPVGAFETCLSLTSITIPSSVTNIGAYAFFALDGSLREVFFEGDAPAVGENVFNNSAVIYYLPGTTGWGPRLGLWPTAPWVRPDPTILVDASGFGMQAGGFCFTISWATNRSVVVEASTNLFDASWAPVATNTFSEGTATFRDPQSVDHPRRFYRLRAL